jgi:hypothetical protein
VSSIQICLAGFVAKSRVWGAIFSQTVPGNPHPLRLDDMSIGINHVAFNSGIGMDCALMLLTISDDED